MILLALAMQTVAQAAVQAGSPAKTATAAPERFSILLPDCRTPTDKDDIVVCSRGPTSQRLPLPDDRGAPDGGGANRERSGSAALALQSTPCAATQRGCQVGVNVLGPPVMLVRVISKLVNPSNDCCAPGEATDPVALARDGVKGVKRIFARKPDKSGRIPIPLDDEPASAAPPPIAADGSAHS